MGVLLINIPGREGGQLRTPWREEKENECEAARLLFDEYAAKGYCAYKANGVEGGTIVKQFDKEAEEIRMQYPMQAG